VTGLAPVRLVPCSAHKKKSLEKSRDLRGDNQI
jgi:hypothetical protein